jgi:hypothetical protein
MVGHMHPSKPSYVYAMMVGILGAPWKTMIQVTLERLHGSTRNTMQSHTYVRWLG